MNRMATTDLPLGVGSVAAARRFTARTLTQWGGYNTVARTAAVLVSELVTNALMFGHGASCLTLSAADDGLLIEVIDASLTRPAARPITTDDEHGRGLHIVARLSEEWGVSEHPAGKVVWCRLAAPAARAHSAGERAS